MRCSLPSFISAALLALPFRVSSCQFFALYGTSIEFLSWLACISPGQRFSRFSVSMAKRLACRVSPGREDKTCSGCQTASKNDKNSLEMPQS